MASSDFTLEANQQVLRWILGQPTTQYTAPVVARWMADDSSTSVTPGTEVSAGAPSRVALSYSSATHSMGSDFSLADSDDMTSGSLIWPGPDTLITGNELWDSSSPPKRICYDKSNFGFNVKEGDVLEWNSGSSSVAISAYAIDSAVLAQALNWVLTRTSGWTKPVAPFRIKLIQDTDYQGAPKSTLENAPMQAVSFGPVGVDSDNQATALSNINVVFPSFSDINDVVVSSYEIWDSSPTPRRIFRRIAGQDVARDGYSRFFATVPAGESLTIPLGSLKITLGRGDM